MMNLNYDVPMVVIPSGGRGKYSKRQIKIITALTADFMQANILMLRLHKCTVKF